MRWQFVTIQLPQSPYFTVGLILSCVILLCWNMGMVVAMRYERRVR